MSFLRGIFVFTAVLISAVVIGQPMFHGIDPSPAGAIGGTVYGLSPDGKVVVGRVQIPGLGYEAFRWESDQGVVRLGSLSQFWLDSYARAASAQGAEIVGYSFGGNGPEAFLWTESSGMLGIGDLPGGSFESLALDVSAAGSVIVGYGYGEQGRTAVQWTDESGLVPLPLLPRFTGSLARAVSADGSTIVGEMFNSEFRQAVYWRHGVATAITPPSSLVGSSYATDVSWDGAVIVGKAGLNCGPGGTCDGTVFRWTEESGSVNVGMAVPYDAPVSVSGDGVFIVTRASVHGGAAIWPSIQGLCDLREIFEKRYGLDMEAYPTLTEASAISADGRTITGNSPNGMWIARILYSDVPGDTNRDQCVDDADLTNVLLDYDIFPHQVHGETDLDCTGTVDDADITIVILNFGQGC